MRVSDETRQGIKQQILKYLKDNGGLQTTFDIAKNIDRHHSFTNQLLHELKDDNQVAISRIGTITAWRLISEQRQKAYVKIVNEFEIDAIMLARQHNQSTVTFEFHKTDRNKGYISVTEEELAELYNVCKRDRFRLEPLVKRLYAAGMANFGWEHERGD